MVSEGLKMRVLRVQVAREASGAASWKAGGEDAWGLRLPAGSPRFIILAVGRFRGRGGQKGGLGVALGGGFPG
ncbi:MAG: hypothetical protein ACJAZN_001859 [Planctomycetota bacterium]